MLRRILIIAAWTIGSLIAWVAAWVIAFRSLVYLADKHQVYLPEGKGLLLIEVIVVGFAAIPLTVLVLAAKGKLPGMRGHALGRRGFPVELAGADAPSDPKQP